MSGLLYNHHCRQGAKKKIEIGAQEDQLEDTYILISKSSKAASGSTFAFKVIEFCYKTATNVAHNSLMLFKACLLNKHYSDFFFLFKDS